MRHVPRKPSAPAARVFGGTSGWARPVHTAPTHACLRLRLPGGYKSRQLTALALRLTALAPKREVYAYFKHEEDPTGALNAASFLKSATKLQAKAAR